MGDSENDLKATFLYFWNATNFPRLPVGTEGRLERQYFIAEY